MKNPDPLVCEFIRFCSKRCDSNWPALYDEMCWVAGRRLFQGMGYSELGKLGISFGLNKIDDTVKIVELVTSQSSETGS